MSDSTTTNADDAETVAASGAVPLATAQATHERTEQMRTWPRMAPPPPIEPGDMSTVNITIEPLLFGRYRRLRELGRGGMGIVWLAHDEVLQLPVALKLVPGEVACSSEALETLRKEVLRGMALTHSGIVRVYSFEKEQSVAAIIMEYVDGPSLADLQAEQPHRSFSPEQLRPWLEQLCAVLDYAHGEARIVHRDLKPRNIMLTSEGRLKVADFGIASSLTETMSGVSVRNDSAGTPPYMGPQQAMGQRPTITDDIYALGATLYDLLTGRPPFFRGNIIAQVLHEPAAPANARRAELHGEGYEPIPAAWEHMLAACLSKGPVHRPTSGAALLQMLDHPQAGLVPYVPPKLNLVHPVSAPYVPLAPATTGAAISRIPTADAQIIEGPAAQQLVPAPSRGVATVVAGGLWKAICVVFGALGSVLVAVGGEAITWFRRLLFAALIVGALYVAYYLFHTVPRQATAPAPSAPAPTTAPAPAAPQYIVLPPPPGQGGQMVPGYGNPPPGWQPPGPNGGPGFQSPPGGYSNPLNQPPSGGPDRDRPPRRGGGPPR